MENIVVDCVCNIEGIIENITLTNEKIDIVIEQLELFIPYLTQLNGYFYILIFSLVGVGLFLLLYKFLKIFL